MQKWGLTVQICWWTFCLRFLYLASIDYEPTFPLFRRRNTIMLGPRKGPFRDLVLKYEQCFPSIINLRCIFYTDVFDHTIYVLVFSQYYKRLFPYSQYARWLQYGNVDKNYMANRELSFTLADDIYIRYLSFTGADDLEAEMIKRFLSIP